MFNLYSVSTLSSRLSSMGRNLDYVVILFSLGLSVYSLLQNAAKSPAVSGDYVNSSIRIKVLNVTVPRDAASLGSVIVTCMNNNGTPLANAPVSISVSSPGIIVSPMSGFGATDSRASMIVQVKSRDHSVNNATATLTTVCNYVVNNSAVTFMGVSTAHPVHMKRGVAEKQHT